MDYFLQPSLLHGGCFIWPWGWLLFVLICPIWVGTVLPRTAHTVGRAGYSMQSRSWFYGGGGRCGVPAVRGGVGLEWGLGCGDGKTWCRGEWGGTQKGGLGISGSGRTKYRRTGGKTGLGECGSGWTVYLKMFEKTIRHDHNEKQRRKQVKFSGVRKNQKRGGRRGTVEETPLTAVGHTGDRTRTTNSARIPCGSATASCGPTTGMIPTNEQRWGSPAPGL